MKRSGRKWSEELKLRWKNYLVQSLLGGAVMFLLFLFLSLQKDAVIIASIAATAFIVFATPDGFFALPKNIIGGHLTGLICGLSAALVLRYGFAQSNIIAVNIAYSLAIGASIFFMAAFNLEHPPAAGTALGVAIQGWSWQVIIAVVVSVALLSLVQPIAEKYLDDLT
jgi:CBS domain-containing membrane protein